MPGPPNTLPNELTFRPGSVSDLDTLYALDCVCFDEDFRFSRAQMKQYLQRKGAIVPVAEFAGGIAGFAIAHVNRQAAYLMTLDVAPSQRGKGLGRKLLESTERDCADAGAKNLWLHVWEHNLAAIKLYERNGYQQQGTEAGFYPGGKIALIYRKQLTNLAAAESLS